MSKAVSLFLRLKSPVVQALRDAAHKKGISPNNLVRMWLREELPPSPPPAPAALPEWTIMHLHVPQDIQDHYKGNQPLVLDLLNKRLGL